MKKDSKKRMDSQEFENRPSLEHKKFAIIMIHTVSKFKIHLCLKTIPPNGVRVVNGVDKYVTESMLTKKEEDIASVKPIDKGRPRQKPTVTSTSVSIPVLERKWVDIETQRSHDHKCYEVSKAMT